MTAREESTDMSFSGKIKDNSTDADLYRTHVYETGSKAIEPVIHAVFWSLVELSLVELLWSLYMESL
jgi:hypothetical protein